MFSLQEFILNPHHPRTVLDMDHNLTVNFYILRIPTLRAAKDFVLPNALPTGWCPPRAGSTTNRQHSRSPGENRRRQHPTFQVTATLPNGYNNANFNSIKCSKNEFHICTNLAFALHNLQPTP